MCTHSLTSQGIGVNGKQLKSRRARRPPRRNARRPSRKPSARSTSCTTSTPLRRSETSATTTPADIEACLAAFVFRRRPIHILFGSWCMRSDRRASDRMQQGDDMVGRPSCATDHALRSRARRPRAESASNGRTHACAASSRAASLIHPTHKGERVVQVYSRPEHVTDRRCRDSSSGRYSLFTNDHRSSGRTTSKRHTNYHRPSRVYIMATTRCEYRSSSLGRSG